MDPLVLLSSSLPCFSQDFEPRRWSHLPTGSNFAGTAYSHTEGNISFIDNAHLLPPDALHKPRLLLEDFPKNHNLILIGQPQLNTTLQLRHHADFKNPITYSAKIDTRPPAALTEYIRAGLPHHTFTDDATALILRVSEGTLRAVKNLRVDALIETVRDRTKTVDLKQVNAVLMQPHWRHNSQDEPAQPIVATNQKSRHPAYPLLTKRRPALRGRNHAKR
ncbi:MAG: hypothetical protein Q8Q59_08410 [Luteolibacter sp.]|nr:hypothetical protein [Luteolibacter sp.]